MTNKEVMQQALEALERADKDDFWREQRDAITALRTALEQQAEPVSHAAIAGALFDFMGWLTTRKERLVLSSVDNASPAADAIKVFAEMRGLSLDDARVQDWQNYTTPPQQQAEPVAWMCCVPGQDAILLFDEPSDERYPPKYKDPLYTTPPQRQWVGLTDDEIQKIWDVAAFAIPGWSRHIAYGRAVEAKLKERNNG